MKIVRFEKGSDVSFGVLDGDTIEVIEGYPCCGMNRSGKTEKLAGVKLLAPVTPPNIIAIGLNYRKHAEESGIELPDHPLLFLKAPTTLTGPDQPIVLPAIAPGSVDYEAELVVVIGKKAKNVSPEHAGDYILGYTCGNDVSARDVQLKQDTQWARGKSFDTFAPIGPWIETEVGGNDRPITLRLNGQVMQQSNTSDLIFNCEQLVSFLSRCMTLLPSTVIFTGTPSGVGFARKPQVFLKAGDVVEVDIEGIGVLKNTVAAEQA